MAHDAGPRSRRMLRYLRRRAQAPASLRLALDTAARRRLFGPGAVVFTDTADFTLRTLRDGILHFLMLFDRIVSRCRPRIERTGGEVLKVEGDSLLLYFPDVTRACRGVEAIEAALRDANRGLPKQDRFRFSYGIGCGELLLLERDVFGLEVNLASKLGEDLAKPGEALLTPAAAAAVPAALRKRLVHYRTVDYGGLQIPIHRLRLPRR